MKNTLVLLIIVWSSCVFAQNSTNDVHLNCINYIKNSEVAKKFICEQFGSDSIKLLISEEVIPFSHSSLIEDVIRKNYINDYSMFNKPKDTEIALVNNVSDSLISLDTKFNRDYSRHLDRLLVSLSDSVTPNLVVYFSKILNQSLYVELIPCIPEFCYDYYKNKILQGEALTFLFLFDSEGEIIKSYHGIIHKD